MWHSNIVSKLGWSSTLIRFYSRTPKKRKVRLLLTNASKHTPYTLSFNSNISTMLRTFSNPQLYAMQEFLQNLLLMVQKSCSSWGWEFIPLFTTGFSPIPGGCLGFLNHQRYYTRLWPQMDQYKNWVPKASPKTNMDTQNDGPWQRWTPLKYGHCHFWYLPVC